jgi:2-succinyl-5-enolpyruvyl-6-hydroxy-3-cyclohexene-1-carboxylate synthase
MRETTANWARTFVQELHRAGVRNVVVAPGSRSTPLVLAFARHGGFSLRVHLDERSAGFLALGLGKATGTPAAVVTTSGTATANLLPAVVEASQGEAPLLVLTADRPHRLRGADANQAIDQVGLYGGFTRESIDVSLPSSDPAALHHLRLLADRAVAMAGGGPAGPVHLNFPFEKPLEPHPDETGAASPETAGGESPLTRIVTRSPHATDEDVEWLSALLSESRAPLVVVGPDPAERTQGSAIAQACDDLGIPLLADPLSGARYSGSAGVPRVCHYDPILRDPRVRDALEPDLVLRVGNAPTSATLLSSLSQWTSARQVVLDPWGRYKDHQGTARDYLRVDAAQLMGALTRAVAGGSPLEARWAPYRERWLSADGAAAEVAGELPAEFQEGRAARAALGAVPEGGTLFLSSSMPIRDVDAFAGRGPAEVRALGNRGASGIDGVVSTALGAALGTGRPTVALLGDLALFHDQNGLLAARDVDVPVAFVVIHNDGGGIFHRLPVAEHEPWFTPLFATPHGLDFAHSAELFGIPCRRVEDVESLRDELRGSLGHSGVRLFVVPARRVQNHEARQAVERHMARAAAESLGVEAG